MRRVRAADPESAELADVAISGLVLLELIWDRDEGCPPVAGFWRRIRMAVEVAPVVADLQTAIDAARGLRDLYGRLPDCEDLQTAADDIERRAWERERARLGRRPMPTEESYASESLMGELEERVARLEQFFKLVLEIVPVEWLLSELGDRTHGGEKEPPGEEPRR